MEADQIKTLWLVCKKWRLTRLMLLQDIYYKVEMYIYLRICENISLRIADALSFPLTANALKIVFSTFNVKTCFRRNFKP